MNITGSLGLYEYQRTASATASAGRRTRTGASTWAIGKGQMGSALMASLHNLCFLTEGLFWVLPLNLLLYAQKCQGVPFSPVGQIHYLCSGPISVDPIQQSNGIGATGSKNPRAY